MKLLLVHHLSEEDRELLIAIANSLTALVEGTTIMISKEVQDLIDISRQSNNVIVALEARFGAMTAQIAALQVTIASLKAGSVMTDDERNAITTLTSELAENVSHAQADITANVDAANPVPATAPAPAPTPEAAITDPTPQS